MNAPKYRRHSARNQAFVEWHGARHYLPGVYDSRESRAAYRQFLFANVYTDQVAANSPPAAVAVADLVVAFMRKAADRYPVGDRSEYHNIRRALIPLCEIHGATPIVKFRSQALQQVQQHMLSLGWSRRHTNDQIRRIRTVFRWGIAAELVPPENLAALEVVRPLRLGEGRETAPREAVPWSIVTATLQHLAPVVRDMVLLQSYTGARPHNLCHLCPGEVDRSSKTWIWRPRQHKTLWRGQDLEIYLGPRAQSVLEPYLGGPPDVPCFRPPRSLRPHYDTQSYARAVTRAAQRAGVPHWSPYQLRHAHAQRVRTKFGIEAAQGALGHASVDSTLIYAARNRELAQRVAAELG